MVGVGLERRKTAVREKKERRFDGAAKVKKNEVRYTLAADAYGWTVGQRWARIIRVSETEKKKTKQ